MPDAKPEILEAAREAGLRYVSDEKPGITRRREGEGFRLVPPKGGRLSHNDRVRIKRLAIPPAWEEVWICPCEDGHLQATGKDVKGRKQYRYHEDWRAVRDQNKYDRMIAFGKALPGIRRRVDRDLKQPGLPRSKVIATVVRLLETTLIRVGNDEYVKANHSYGLTTMRNRHVTVRGAKVTFSFKGKSGKHHVIDIENKRLAQIVRRCQELPGHELFGYVDEEGQAVDVNSADVNAYLHEITGEPFTAKDFRTWAGTVLAAKALQEFEAFGSPTEAKRNMLTAIEAVSKMLGNTPTICRKCYVHPIVLETYLDGNLVEQLTRKAEAKLAHSIKQLRADEAAVMMLLHDTLKKH